MTEGSPILIRGARLIDPTTGSDTVGDLLIIDGVIHSARKNIRDGSIPPGTSVVAHPGLAVCPGFVDLHAHFREPGFEDHETIQTGVQAAARGGFTTVCCMPNTRPAMDNASVVDYVLKRAREADGIRVLPIGCVSKKREGKELAELWEMAQSSVVAFSDDGSPVATAHLMRQALSYAQGLALPVIDHCEDLTLTKDAPVNEGWLSNRLGLAGWPAVAEETIVARDIELANLTKGHLHLAHLTTARSVAMVRRAKERGLPVTAEVTPHHLTLSEEWVLGHDDNGPITGPLSTHAYDTSTKVNPPLRTQQDIEALLLGLADGTIDAIATDHAPHAITAKLVSYDDAAFGISGLETAFGALMQLVHDGSLSMSTLIARLTTGPLQILPQEYLELGSLREGTTADLVLFDTDQVWTVRGEDFASKGKTTPLEGVALRGQVMGTISGGRMIHSSLKQSQQGSSNV